MRGISNAAPSVLFCGCIAQSGGERDDAIGRSCGADTLVCRMDSILLRASVFRYSITFYQSANYCRAIERWLDRWPHLPRPNACVWEPLSADRHAHARSHTKYINIHQRMWERQTKCADEEILIGRCIIALELFFPLELESRWRKPRKVGAFFSVYIWNNLSGDADNCLFINLQRFC